MHYRYTGSLKMCPGRPVSFLIGTTKILASSPGLAEARCNANAIGLVKLMGRHCGFIAMNAALVAWACNNRRISDLYPLSMVYKYVCILSCGYIHVDKSKTYIHRATSICIYPHGYDTKTDISVQTYPYGYIHMDTSWFTASVGALGWCSDTCHDTMNYFSWILTMSSKWRN